MTKRKYSSVCTKVCVYRYMQWYRRLLEGKPQLIRRMRRELDGFPPYWHHDTDRLLPRALFPDRKSEISFMNTAYTCTSNPINIFLIQTFFFKNCIYILFELLFFQTKVLFVQLFMNFIGFLKPIVILPRIFVMI